jgi:hypothetical protein
MHRECPEYANFVVLEGKQLVALARSHAYFQLIVMQSAPFAPELLK